MPSTMSVLFALEFVVPGVHFIWLGLAAALTAALLYVLAAFGMGEPMALPVQLLLFVGLSVISLFVIRRFGATPDTKTDTPALNIRGAQYIGRDVSVEMRSSMAAAASASMTACGAHKAKTPRAVPRCA